MKHLNLAIIHKNSEQKDMEELTRHQMNRASAGQDLATAACEDWCTVTGDAIGELIYFHT